MAECIECGLDPEESTSLEDSLTIEVARLVSIVNDYSKQVFTTREALRKIYDLSTKLLDPTQAQNVDDADFLTQIVNLATS